MKCHLYFRAMLFLFMTIPNISFADAVSSGNPDSKYLENTSDCRVWINHVQDKSVIEWSGNCVDLYILRDGIVGESFPEKSERYVGGMKDGKPEGSGLMQFLDGRTLSGEFHKGVVSGVVEYAIPNGFYYKGEWSGGAEEGKGIAAFPSGNQYSGMWHHGQTDGYGTMTSPSGTVHEGVFRDGRPNGHGIASKPDGYRIEGEWVDGILNGHGSYSSVHGARYDGDFKNGKPDGLGNYTANNGDTYQGSWHHGVPDGQGTITRKSGVFVGEWKNGCLPLNKSFIALMVDPKSCEKVSD